MKFVLKGGVCENFRTLFSIIARAANIWIWGAPWVSYPGVFSGRPAKSRPAVSCCEGDRGRSQPTTVKYCWPSCATAPPAWQSHCVGRRDYHTVASGTIFEEAHAPLHPCVRWKEMMSDGLKVVHFRAIGDRVTEDPDDAPRKCVHRSTPEQDVQDQTCCLP